MKYAQVKGGLAVWAAEKAKAVLDFVAEVGSAHPELIEDVESPMSLACMQVIADQRTSQPVLLVRCIDNANAGATFGLDGSVR